MPLKYFGYFGTYRGKVRVLTETLQDLKAIKCLYGGEVGNQISRKTVLKAPKSYNRLQLTSCIPSLSTGLLEMCISPLGQTKNTSSRLSAQSRRDNMRSVLPTAVVQLPSKRSTIQQLL